MGEELEAFLLKQKEGKLAAEAAKKCVCVLALIVGGGRDGRKNEIS